MTTSITAFPVPNLGKVGGKPTSLMGVYRFRTPRGDVLLGFYQNFEATGDNLCTSGQRRLLTPAEALTYATEGTLPADFESRPVIGGGYGKDAAKDDLAQRTILRKEVAPKEVSAQALVKPAFDAAEWAEFKAFQAFKAAQK